MRGRQRPAVERGRATVGRDGPAHADVVIPTVGRDSLALLLASLDGPPDRLPHRVIVVDDRPDRATPLPCADLSPELRERLDVFASEGHGPAAARNRGWHASGAEWIAFLDEDVIPCRGWLTELRGDLNALPGDVAASQGRVRVPIEKGHAPSHPAHPLRAGANVAYRRSALLRVGGYDERVPGAAREDADLTLRVCDAGLRIVDGRRTVMHPAWPADPGASARAQTDAAMHAGRGSQWWGAARTATTAARRHALVLRAFARQRFASGARTVRALAVMPFAALAHRLAPGARTSRHTEPPRIARRPVDAVLFERDDAPGPAARARPRTIAGARAVRVPNDVTRWEDEAGAPELVPTRPDAVDQLLRPED